MFSSRLALAAALAAIHVPAAAQSATLDSAAAEDGGASTATAANTPTPGSAEDAHSKDNDAIVVTGVRKREGDVLGGISVLDETELTREVRPSIGETLARQPGVTATSFGPQASAPVLRG